ncbi:aspartate aminotransferase [Candidatus Falkowbacteria bacterium CG10_big_fil_rev_8_21_14_0_10_43_10]|uniref:Aspartate aminotransferase n=1 Tax=Candidatus Falkowbacteria bacterium CG10_big_fil_rev_8_21_14_0_10_43_10 TaxID=1974567 RepID=A0A2H0V2V6_9BACT|nr:MAG: aspartate aminotransferase [Candidatus Falkowbacteria bacterium CG10_big_fil_rev_8_21_14_0_10_43_10]
MPKISRRGQNIFSSPIRKFLPLVLEAEKRGIKVFKINVGDPDIAPPASFFPAIRSYQKKILPYAPSPGIKEHTAAWVKYYRGFGLKLKPADIIPTMGGAEAILLAITAVADPGDEFLIFEPFYASYKGFATMSGVKLTPVTLKVENNFALPPIKEIKSKINRRTRGIIIINPNNPTGMLWAKKDLAVLVKIAREHNIFIISDETYREIIFQGKPVSILQLPRAKDCAIVVDSASKRFSCPGARIGCVASYNKEAMRSILKFAMTRLSVPTLEQIGLVPALSNAGPYTKKIAAEYKKRRDVVLNALKKMPGVVCREPQGAFYIIAKLPVKNAEDFVKFMLTGFNYNKNTVMVTPAEDFYITKGLGRDEVRIAFVLNIKELKEAMEILAKGLAAYHRKSDSYKF